MTDKPHGKRSGWGPWACVVLALMLLYVLSVGPMTPVAVCFNDVWPYMDIYSPVFRVATALHPLDHLLRWYINKWVFP
jgi:hypothetical protein